MFSLVINNANRSTSKFILQKATICPLSKRTDQLQSPGSDLEFGLAVVVARV